jgi:hypothetical protein
MQDNKSRDAFINELKHVYADGSIEIKNKPLTIKPIKKGLFSRLWDKIKGNISLY